MSNEPKNVPEMLEALADATGGAITDAGLLPDGSGFAMLSTPLREDHWLYQTDPLVPGFAGPSPMPMAGHHQDPLRVILQGHLQTAARYGVRSSTCCGREEDFDPDVLVRNVEIGLFGYYGKNSPYSHDLEYEPVRGGKLLHVVEDALDVRGRTLAEIRERVNRRLSKDLEQTANLDTANLIHPAFHVELKTIGALMLRHNQSSQSLLTAMTSKAVNELGVDPELAKKVIFAGLGTIVDFDPVTLKDWNAFDEERRRKWREDNPEAAAQLSETVACGASATDVAE